MINVFFWQWEAVYLEWFQHLGANGALHTVLEALNNTFSFFGEELICVLIMGFLYWGVDKERGIRLGFAVIMTNISNGMIKNIIKRLRPYIVLENVELLREVDGYSFPSGHSANSATIYPGLAFEFREKKWFKWFKYVAVIIPLCVALSRNFLGAHWPTDVMVGLLQGALVLVIIEVLYAKIDNEKIIFLILLIISSIGLFYCETDDYFSSYGMLLGAILGRLFERKYVNFENSGKLVIRAYRTILGGLIFVGLNMSLKALFGLFGMEGYGDFLLRSLRYAIDVFVLFGVYPLAFRLERKALAKNR